MTTLGALVLSGPREMWGTAGTLDFDAEGAFYVVTAVGRRFGWPWESLSVTFDAEIGRRTDGNLFFGLPLAALFFRRKGFKVQITAAQDHPVTFWVHGDGLLRDSVARRVVSDYPTASGRVAVGAQTVTP